MGGEQGPEPTCELGRAVSVLGCALWSVQLSDGWDLLIPSAADLRRGLFFLWLLLSHIFVNFSEANIIGDHGIFSR